MLARPVTHLVACRRCE